MEEQKGDVSAIFCLSNVWPWVHYRTGLILYQRQFGVFTPEWAFPATPSAQHAWYTVLHDLCLNVIYIFCESRFQQERPYQHDSTASRLLSEVKHVRARLVLRWGTTLESRVLFSFFNFFCHFFSGVVLPGSLI